MRPPSLVQYFKFSVLIWIIAISWKIGYCLDYGNIVAFPAESEIVNSIAHPTENWVYCVDATNFQIHVFDTDQGRFIKSQSIISRGINEDNRLSKSYETRYLGATMLISPDASRLYVSSLFEGMIEVFSLPELIPLEVWQMERDLQAVGIGELGVLIAKTWDNYLYAIDADNGQILSHEFDLGVIRGIVVSDDGTRMIGVHFDKDRIDREIIREWEISRNGINFVRDICPIDFREGVAKWEHTGWINWQKNIFYGPTSSYKFATDLNTGSPIDNFFSDTFINSEAAFSQYTPQRKEFVTSLVTSSQVELLICDSDTGLRKHDIIIWGGITSLCQTVNGKVFFTWYDRSDYSDGEVNVGIWGDNMLSPILDNQSDLHIFGLKTVEIEGQSNSNEFPNTGESLNLSFYAMDFGNIDQIIESITLSFSDNRFIFTESGQSTLTFNNLNTHRFENISFSVPQDALDGEAVILRIESIRGDGSKAFFERRITIADNTAFIVGEGTFFPLALLADHSREVFYMADVYRQALHAIDAVTGKTIASATLVELDNSTFIPPYLRMELAESPDGSELYCIDLTDDRQIIQRFTLPSLEPTGIIRPASQTSAAIVSPDNELFLNSILSYGGGDGDDIRELRKIDFADGLTRKVVGVSVPSSYYSRDLNYLQASSKDGSVLFTHGFWRDLIARWKYNYSEKTYDFDRNYFGPAGGRSEYVLDEQNDQYISFSRVPSMDPNPWINAITVLELDSGTEVNEFNGLGFRDSRNQILLPQDITLDTGKGILYTLSNGNGRQVVLHDVLTRELLLEYTLPSISGALTDHQIVVTPEGRVALTWAYSVMTKGGGKWQEPLGAPYPAIEITNSISAYVGNEITLSAIIYGECQDNPIEWILVEGPDGSMLSTDVLGNTILAVEKEGTYLLQAKVICNGDFASDEIRIHAFSEQPSVQLNGVRTDADISQEKLIVDVELSHPLDFVVFVDIVFSGGIQIAYAGDYRDNVYIFPGETKVRFQSKNDAFLNQNENTSNKTGTISLNTHWFLDTSVNNSISLTERYPFQDTYSNWQQYHQTTYGVFLDRTGDYDGDGILNFDEFQYCTNPLKADEIKPMVTGFENLDGAVFPYIKVPKIRLDGSSGLYQLLESIDLINWKPAENWSFMPIDREEPGYTRLYYSFHPIGLDNPVYFQFQANAY